MMSTTFTTGDAVLVYRDHHDTKPARATVLRTTSRTVVLDDGQRFGADGIEWGMSGQWRYRRIELAPKVEVVEEPQPVPARTELAKAAFYGSNEALMRHLLQMDSYTENGVEWPSNGMSLERAISLVESLSDEDMSRALGIVPAPQAEPFVCPKCGLTVIKELHFCTAGEAVPTPPTVTKRIGYNKDSHDYDCYVSIDGEPEQYIGSASSYTEGESTCRVYAYNYYTDNHTPEAAVAVITEMQQAAQDGGDPEQVELVEGEIEIPTHEDYHKNKDRTGRGEYQPCVVCGRGIKAKSPAMVRVHHGGTHLVTEARAAQLADTADLGLYPIGPCCLRKHPELKRFVIPTSIDPPPPEDEQASEFCAQRPCPECGKADCPGSAAEPAQSGLCWCVTWMAQGHAGECPDCRWRAAQVPPPDATIEEIVELAYAMRHIPLPDEERWGHKRQPNVLPPCIVCGPDNDCWWCDPATAPTPTELIALGICPACDGHHHPQNCTQVGAALMCEEAPFTDVCTSCGDQLSWQGPGICPACRESGEGKPHTHVNADVNGGEYMAERKAAAREAESDMEAIAGDIGGVVAYVNGRLTIVDFP